MNGKRALGGLFLAVALLLPLPAFANSPVLPRRLQPGPERQLPRQDWEADVLVGIAGKDFLELRFWFNRPGEVKYVLRGPQGGRGAGLVAATGHRVLKQQGILVEKMALPVLRNNEVARYTLEADFHLKMLELTPFGLKETNREKEKRVIRHFVLIRKDGVTSVIPGAGNRELKKLPVPNP